VPKTLIVPLDGTTEAERALRVAQSITTRTGGDLALLSADTEDGERMRPYLDEVAGRMSPAPSRTECVTGGPTGAILRAAQAAPDAVVCMATHGRGRLAAPMLGSVAAEVVRAIDRPMLLVGPRCDEHWWHDPPQLVACWAGEGSDAVLAPAQEWSDALDADLSLLCVFHPLDVPASVEPAAQFAPALAQLDARHADTTTVALHEELPALAVSDYARRLPATLLAVTTRGRSLVSRAVLGSVAQEIVHHSPCPVLVVRGGHQ
jgi:nucleotide-binding universal stress UspA family protein